MLKISIKEIPRHDLPKELTRLRQEGWQWKQYRDCKSTVIKFTGAPENGPTSNFRRSP